MRSHAVWRITSTLCSAAWSTTLRCSTRSQPRTAVKRVWQLFMASQSTNARRHQKCSVLYLHLRILCSVGDDPNNNNKNRFFALRTQWRGWTRHTVLGSVQQWQYSGTAGSAMNTMILSVRTFYGNTLLVVTYLYR